MRASTLAVATLLASIAVSQAEEKRELGSHEHGHVTLAVAIEGGRLEMELEAPGQNIVGFEHAAETDEQKAAVEKARTQLADAAAVFTLPEAAGCTADEAKVELHSEGEHNAFEVRYTYTCSKPAELTRIETKLFALYPTIEEVDVDYATAGGQGSVELEADKPVIALPGSA